MTQAHPPDRGREERSRQLNRNVDRLLSQMDAVTSTLTGEALWLRI
jgi:hypothetical protein